MNILIAPDSFKDCLPAAGVARFLSEGIRRVYPSAAIVSIPLSDGGEGFVETMLAAMGGRGISVPVFDPLMRITGRTASAGYGILPDGTAIIEMAAASGIELLTRDERNPLTTSTYGTGQLMLDAMERGCRKLIVGIGGSATNDGGTGMAQALGYRFLDKTGAELPPGGGNLHKLSRIDGSAVSPLLGQTTVWAACDVTNPLCGKHGASVVYGPQKGASPEAVLKLDANLAYLAELLQKQLGANVLHLPGAGAAGGLGAGLVAFCKGQLQSGFDLVKEQTGLEAAVQQANIVVTGEGKLDAQTFRGKVPWGVAQLAQKYGKPVLAFAGSLGNGYHQLYANGFTSVFALPQGPATLSECLANAPKLLADTAEQVFRVLKMEHKAAKF
ncbi:MAG: glycerate kinase [Mangrovibacterium sp.]